tara:strand:- start:11 stop:253 length:243 start_codon:yes stop_codon:yes gene_type:complete
MRVANDNILETQDPLVYARHALSLLNGDIDATIIAVAQVGLNDIDPFFRQVVIHELEQIKKDGLENRPASMDEFPEPNSD